MQHRDNRVDPYVLHDVWAPATRSKDFGDGARECASSTRPWMICAYKAHVDGLRDPLTTSSLTFVSVRLRSLRIIETEASQVQGLVCAMPRTSQHPLILSSHNVSGTRSHARNMLRHSSSTCVSESLERSNMNKNDQFQLRGTSGSAWARLRASGARLRAPGSVWQRLAAFGERLGAPGIRCGKAPGRASGSLWERLRASRGLANQEGCAGCPKEPQGP